MSRLIACLFMLSAVTCFSTVIASNHGGDDDCGSGMPNAAIERADIAHNGPDDDCGSKLPGLSKIARNGPNDDCGSKLPGLNMAHNGPDDDCGSKLPWA